MVALSITLPKGKQWGCLVLTGNVCMVFVVLLIFNIKGS